MVASWQLVMAGVLQAVGLALLGLGGAFFLGAKNNPFSLLFTLGGFVALLILAQAVASRPELIDGIGCRVLSWVNSVRGRPAETGLDRWRQTLMQLESVSLSRRDMGWPSAGPCSTGSRTWPASASRPTPPAITRRSPD